MIDEAGAATAAKGFVLKPGEGTEIILSAPSISDDQISAAGK